MFREMSCWTLFTKQFYISSVFGSWSIYKMFPSLFRILLTLPDKNIFCSLSRALFLHKGYMLLSFFIHFLFRPRQFTTLIERVPWASQSRKWVSSIFLFSLCTTDGTQEFSFEQLTFIELLYRLKPCLQLTCSLIGTDDQEHNQICSRIYEVPPGVIRVITIDLGVW